MNNQNSNFNAYYNALHNHHDDANSHFTAHPPLHNASACPNSAFIPDAPLAQLDRALPSEAEGQALKWLRSTGIEDRRNNVLAKFGKRA